MTEHLEPIIVDVSPGTPAVSSENGVAAPPLANGASSRHAAAGRKGAERIHQLIQRGRLYEQEHGLKRGRQRLRQLIEEGKVYEQEHGLNTGRRAKRRARVSPEQHLRRLVDALLVVVKPAYRLQLLKLVRALEDEGERRDVNPPVQPAG
jgi:hypothetical protein